MIGRIQGGLASVLAATYAGLATVLWAPSEYPRAAGEDLVVARLLTGPSIALGTQGGIGTYELPQAATIAVGAVAAGDRAVLEVDGARWYHDVEAGETSADVRDALLAAITSATGPAILASAASSGASSIAMTAGALAGLAGLRVAGPLTATPSGAVACVVQHQHETALVELQAFSRNRYPRTGAATLLERFVARSRLPSISDELDRWGVSLWGPPSPVVDLTAISGAGWESRAATQVRAVALSIVAEAVDTIDAATLTLDATEVDQITIEAPQEI